MNFDRVATIFLGILGIVLFPSGTAFISLSTLTKCDHKVMAAIEAISWDKYGKLENITATAADQVTYVGAMTSGQIPKFVDCISYVLHPEGGDKSTGHARFTLLGIKLPFNITITGITENKGDLYVKQTKSKVIPAYYGGNSKEGNLFCLYCCNNDTDAPSGPPVFQIDHTDNYNEKDFQICLSIIKQLNGQSLDYFGNNCKKSSNKNNDGKWRDKIKEKMDGVKSFMKNLLGDKS